MTNWGRVRRLMIVALLVVGGLAVWAAWWWNHAAMLDERLYGQSFDMAPRPVAEATLHTAVMISDLDADVDETFSFRSVDPHFSKNSAGATARLSVCARTESADVIGAVTGSLEQYCDELRPIKAGTSIRWKDGKEFGDYIVLSIEPSHPGVARVDRIEIEYSRDGAHLWQRGTASVEVDVTMRATE